LLYLTDTALEAIPSLAALDPAGQTAALADAGVVYAQVKAGPWGSHDALAAWAPSAGLTIDHLNAALQLLRETGRVHALEDSLPA
jgi:hypothetical protein